MCLTAVSRTDCRGTREENGKIKEPCEETVGIILVRHEGDLPGVVVVLRLVLTTSKLSDLMQQPFYDACECRTSVVGRTGLCSTVS